MLKCLASQKLGKYSTVCGITQTHSASGRTLCKLWSEPLATSSLIVLQCVKLPSLLFRISSKLTPKALFCLIKTQDA